VVEIVGMSKIRLHSEVRHDEVGAIGEGRLALEILRDVAFKLRTAADAGILDLDTLTVDDEKADFVPSQAHRRTEKRRLRGGFGGEYALADLRADVAFWDSEIPSRLMTLIDPDTRGMTSIERRQYLKRMERNRRSRRRRA